MAQTTTRSSIQLREDANAKKDRYDIECAKAFGYYGDDAEGAREFMLSVRAQIKETNTNWLNAVK